MVDSNDVHVPINPKSNKDGKVKVWIPEHTSNTNGVERKVKAGYKRVYAVDARELIALSGADWYSPDDKKKIQKAAGGDTTEASAAASKSIEKTTAKELAAIIAEEGLDVDLKDYTKLGDKRDAVKQAMIAKAQDVPEVV